MSQEPFRLPERPHQPEETPPNPPMIYVQREDRWEYKRVLRDIPNEGVPDDAALNALGAEGWELGGLFTYGSQLVMVFKRLA